MRRSLAVSPIAVAALLVAALSGCLPSDPAPVPSAQPTVEPLFASDDEALAAAEEAYANYLAVSDQIAQEGGANPERVAPYVTEDWLVEEVDAFTRIADSGRRQVGSSRLESAELQRYDVGSSSEEVAIYACVDFAASYFVDSQGTIVTPSTQSTRATFEIQFEVVNDQLLVSGSELWESQALC